MNKEGGYSEAQLGIFKILYKNSKEKPPRPSNREDFEKLYKVRSRSTAHKEIIELSEFYIKKRKLNRRRKKRAVKNPQHPYWLNPKKAKAVEEIIKDDYNTAVRTAKKKKPFLKKYQLLLLAIMVIGIVGLAGLLDLKDLGEIPYDLEIPPAQLFMAQQDLNCTLYEEELIVNQTYYLDEGCIFRYPKRNPS